MGLFGRGSNHSPRQPKKEIPVSSLAELKNLEATRRSKFKSLLAFTRLHVESYKALLLQALDETKQAHRLVLGFGKAQRIMSTPNMDADGPSDMRSLQRCEMTVAQAFSEQSEKLKGIDAKILKNITEVEDLQNELDGQSSSVFQVIDLMERQVQQSWGTSVIFLVARYNVVTSCVFLMLLSLETYQGAVERARRSRGWTQDPPSSQSLVGKKPDQWLSELSYRSALSAQNSQWEQSANFLSELMSQIKNYECRRRINMREYMFVLTMALSGVFATAEQAQETATLNLTDSTRVEGDISNEIESSLQRMSNLSTNSDDQMSTHSAMDGLAELSSRSPATDIFSSPSTLPSESDHLKFSAVVEKVTADGAVLFVGVVAVTTDSVLHLFQARENVTLNQSPDDVFDKIASHRDEGTLGQSIAQLVVAGVGLQSPRNEYALEPTVTLSLKGTTVSASSLDDVVEITKSDSAEPLLLRMASPRLQADLITALHELVNPE